MPHPKDFVYDNEPLDKLNSRSIRSMLFASVDFTGPHYTIWNIKLGSLLLFQAHQSHNQSDIFSLYPAQADTEYCEDILYNSGIKDIDDVLDYLKKRMSI